MSSKRRAAGPLINLVSLIYMDEQRESMKMIVVVHQPGDREEHTIAGPHRSDCTIRLHDSRQF